MVMPSNEVRRGERAPNAVRLARAMCPRNQHLDPHLIFPLHPHCTPHCTPHRTHLQILARELWNSRQLKLGIIDNKGDCLFGTVAQQHFNNCIRTSHARPLRQLRRRSTRA